MDIAPSGHLPAMKGQPTMKHIFAYIGYRKKVCAPANDLASFIPVRRRSKNCLYYQQPIFGELRPIPRLLGFFASESGNIFKQDRLLKGSIGRKGYLRVGISIDGVCKNYYIHALIALAWHGDRPNGFHVDHIDFDNVNNRPENLRYLDPKENSRRRRPRQKNMGFGGG